MRAPLRFLTTLLIFFLPAYPANENGVPESKEFTIQVIGAGSTKISMLENQTVNDLIKQLREQSKTEEGSLVIIKYKYRSNEKKGVLSIREGDEQGDQLLSSIFKEKTPTVIVGFVPKGGLGKILPPPKVNLPRPPISPIVPTFKESKMYKVTIKKIKGTSVVLSVKEDSTVEDLKATISANPWLGSPPIKNQSLWYNTKQLKNDQKLSGVMNGKLDTTIWLVCQHATSNLNPTSNIVQSNQAGSSLSLSPSPTLSDADLELPDTTKASSKKRFLSQPPIVWWLGGLLTIVGVATYFKFFHKGKHKGDHRRTTKAYRPASRL